MDPKTAGHPRPGFSYRRDFMIEIPASGCDTTQQSE